MWVLDMIMAALATQQAVEIWHHGSVFEDGRARAEAWRHSNRIWKQWLGELLCCPFCLSAWVSLTICTCVLIGNLSVYEPVKFAVLLAPTTLAVARLSNLFNDATRIISRTPNRKAAD